MKNAMKYVLIATIVALSAAVVYATDGAIAAWVRDSSGTLTSGVDSSGNIVTPDLTVSDDLSITDDLSVGGDITVTGTATIAGITTGVQTESVTNTATLTVENKLINATGGTGASILVTVASPTSSQLGEFVRLRNVGTNTLNLVNGTTTNAVATGKEILLQAIDASTTGWENVYTTP